MGTYTILVGKIEGNRSLRRPVYMWDNNIKINFKELSY
jgi:hypothetical protein